MVTTWGGRPGLQEVELDVVASPVEPALRLNLEASTEADKDGLSLGESQSRKESTPHLLRISSASKPRTNLDPALLVWRVKSFIREGWTSLPQGWAFCHKADYCITL